jgi:hypothetical protein
VTSRAQVLPPAAIRSAGAVRSVALRGIAQARSPTMAGSAWAFRNSVTNGSAG